MAMDKDIALSSDWLLLLVTATAMAPAEGTCEGSTVGSQGSNSDNSCKKEKKRS